MQLTVRPMIHFARKNPVLDIAFLAALVTSLIVKPDARYLDYFDLRTLSCLLCTLAVVDALKDIDFFYTLARRLVATFKNLRACVLSLVLITYVGSMFIANDMALITFLPLGYFVLNETNQRGRMAFVFILQNIAANLGGMLTPFGNPQNLYLYSHFSIGNLEFMRIMLPPFLLSAVLIFACCFFVKKTPVSLINREEKPMDKKRVAIYLVLFFMTLAVVFRLIPWWLGLALIVLPVLVMDANAVKTVDWPLLCTFVCFFVFSGNMARIPAVRDFLGGLMAKDALLYSTLSCQVISNVPSAVLLSQFTQNYPALLVGVNIGGTGTLIASLASLITFRNYLHFDRPHIGSYLKLFAVMNFAFLGVLLLAMEWIL